MKRIIFYPGPMHLFWTTGIYYIAELCKDYEVTLVLEKATKEDEDNINYLIENKLKKISHIKYANKLRRHWIYKKTAFKLANKIKPDFVFVPDDMYPFNVYLLRKSKQYNAINICYQTGMILGGIRSCKKLLNSNNIADFKSRFKSSTIMAEFAIELINLLKHLWHYIIAPILVGCYPFLGKSSCFLIKGRSAMRDGDYFILFGDRERNICVRDGLDEAKAIVIPHPLLWKSTNKFKIKILNSMSKSYKRINMDVIIFLDNLNHTVDKKGSKIITEKEIFDMWRKIIEVLFLKFPKKTIWIKPHPAQCGKLDVKTMIQELLHKNPNLRLIDKKENAIECLLKSNIVISEVSSLLFIASLLLTNKIIISVDIIDRYMGSVYKNAKNINYISDIKDFECFDFDKTHNTSLSYCEGDKMLKSFLLSAYDA